MRVYSEERNDDPCENLSVLLALALSMTATTAGARAQDKDAKPARSPPKTAAACPAQGRIFRQPITSSKLGGQTIPYKATAATILLKERKGRTNRAGLLHRLPRAAT